MDNGGDILQLCRLCLVKDDVNIPIFDGQGDIRQIFLKISSCLPVKVSREDQLPKKICDGCSYKLDMLYEFWNTTANAEKQLLSWLGEAGMNSKMNDDTISAVAQQIKPVETFVKQETIDPSDIHTEENDDDKTYMFQQKYSVEEAGPSATTTATANEEEPPPKRARRTAAVKAQIAMDPESDYDDDSGEPITKVEDESEESEGEDQEPAFVDVPSTSADDQPGPSGVGKDGVEAPLVHTKLEDTELIKNEDGNSKNEKRRKLKICHICGEHFEENRKLKRHLLSHSSEWKFTCSLCDDTFKTECKLSAHMRAHDDPKTFDCDICGKKLRARSTLTVHRKRHLKDFVVKCEICGKGFVTNLEYKNHIGSKHGTSNNICNICGRVCYNKFTLQAHMIRHDKDYKSNRNIRCELCNKTFLQERCLQNHFNFKHKNGGQKRKKYTCDLCGKEVNSKRSLRNHHLIHEGLKPIKCNECGRGFTSKTSLKSHMLTHTGIKPYKCSHCDKGFSQKTPLAIHMRYHTGERPFTCNVCNDGFISKASLSVHQKNKH